MYSSLMLQNKHQLLKVRLSITLQMHDYASFSGKVSGQCVASDELESLKKEVDTLRNDLQYWKNETLKILKNYLIIKESKCK